MQALGMTGFRPFPAIRKYALPPGPGRRPSLHWQKGLHMAGKRPNQLRQISFDMIAIGFYEVNIIKKLSIHRSVEEEK